MSKGRLESNIEFKSKNEIGILASSYNTVIEMLRDVSSAANNVANGKTDVEIKLKSEEDILAKSFNEMTRKLREQETFNKERFWSSNAIERLSTILRNEKKAEKLGEKICSFLAELLGIQTVTLFLLDQSHLSLTGSYALERGNKINDVLEIGEGLVGQAVIEKKILSITDIPEDYKRISWSQGSSLPSNIVFLPFIFNDEVIGVIEFGALKEIPELKLEFLKVISEPIAIGFFNLNQSSKLQNLLEETQCQAEELQTQQEELRASNEVLTSQTEELKKSEDMLQTQQEELRTSNEELEEKTEILKEQKTDIQERNNRLNEIRLELEEKSKKLSLSTKYKSEFLANMSHELRTPLNSLLLLSKKFMKNKDQNLTEKQVKNAEIIYNSGCDLLNLINDILDLSKIEAGKMTLVVEEVKIINLKNAINDSFGHIMKSKGLEFSIDIDSKLPATIHTDYQKLNQIIKNLLSNAIKFTKQGNIKVKIFKPQRKVDIQNSDLKSATFVAISVTDTGLGIPEDKKQLIFDAFQQADGTTSREFGGTGLGLSISLELAKVLGGEIKIESNIGIGSVFTLFINADLKDKKLKENNEKVELKVLEPPKDAVSMRKKEKISFPGIEDDRENLTENDRVILIIEDDLNFAQVLYDNCKEKKFKCIQCSDGKSGLALALEHIPEAILLDVKLPGEFNGLQVLDELKKNLKTRHIPVHVISVDDLRVKTLNKGAVGFLQKPIKESDINEILISLSSVSTEPKNILIIEDDEGICHSIQETLCIDNLIFSVANTGKEGIEKLASENYSLVILDLTLPDISGFEIMKTIKSQYENLPVIVYTGRELDDKEEHLIAKYSASTILKNAQSTERLLDEVSLFLHTNVNNLSKEDKKNIIDYHSVETSLAGKTVLIVDDDMRNLYLLEEELRDINMNVVKAINGKMAVDTLMKDKKIDIVLMDIMMPVMNGYEAIQKIRKTPNISSVPIIAVTAKAMKEDREKCIDAGANDYITKPVDMDKLTTLMRVWAHK